MKLKIHSNEIEICEISDFDLAKIFECGQCFRWKPEEDNELSLDANHMDCKDSVRYIGVANGCATRVRKSRDNVYISCSIDDFENIWRSYFDLDRDYEEIRERLCIDDFMRNATDYGAGIRLLRQEKWEALCSFIISQNNNIPRIKSIIATLCREFGEAIDFENKQYFTFPSAERLAGIKAEYLAPLRCGYRAEYIVSAANIITNGSINLEALAACSPDIVRSELKKLRGVGDKVADCVMLFGLHMLDAFPLDVWMKRAVVKHYGTDFNPNIFSPYAGIAQQYIFHYSRMTGKTF